MSVWKRESFWKRDVEETGSEKKLARERVKKGNGKREKGEKLEHTFIQHLKTIHFSLSPF